jgi:prevent-host-death family protein
MNNLYSLTEARKEFSRIIKDVQYKGDAYIISRHGEEAAAVGPTTVYKEWKRQWNELFQMI